MRRGGTEVTAERLQNTIGLRCEGTTLERGRGGETYSISSYQCRAWRCVAFCFAFNKHIYTSPSHWMWFKGWLESVDSRPEYTPFPKYTRPMSKLHTHTHTHTHITHSHIRWLVKSLAQLCTRTGLSFTHRHIQL